MSTQADGRFYWHELHTSDLEKAKGFFGELFGWTTRAMEMGPGKSYTLISAAGVDVGGFVKNEQKGPDHFLAYATVSDVDLAIKKAESLGGKVVSPVMDMPGVGRFAAVADPQGAVLSVFKPTELSAESDDQPKLSTFCWNELVTQDPAAGEKFYRGVYGYGAEAKDMGPMGSYTMLKRRDRQAAGIMKAMSPEAPSMWLSYVVVENTDRALEKAKKLGAKELVGPTDIPEIGRFAVVTAPGGATVALFCG